MKKTLILFALAIGSAFSVSAQSVEKGIDKAIRDPKARENAAKADVLIHDKKQITDSASAQKVSATKKKKGAVCRKRNRS